MFLYVLKRSEQVLKMKVKPIQTSRSISAPIETVFQTIADIRNFSKAVPHIVKIEFLTEQKVGVGTRFEETRLMNGREHTVELEVTELVENDRIRMVSDAGGTIWDTVFTVSQAADTVALDMEMDVKPYKLLAKLMTPLIRGTVVKGVATDMDAVKAYCESLRDNA